MFRIKNTTSTLQVHCLEEYRVYCPRSQNVPSHKCFFQTPFINSASTHKLKVTESGELLPNYEVHDTSHLTCPKYSL